MWPASVVILAPVLDHHDGFGQAAELLDVEQLVTDAAVEGLNVGVLPRRAGFDERRLGPSEATPVAQGVCGQLGPVIAADVRRRATPSGDLLEHGHGLV